MSETHLPASPAAVLKKSALNLPWLDCEMTGLAPQRERIIEIAAVVTSADLSVRIPGPVLVIHQSDALLDGMDAWNTRMHGKSGLVARVKESTLSEAQAEAQLLDFFARHIPRGEAPLCGNSIAQDRRFLRRYMPRLDAFFHYRSIDVSTLKELARRWKPDAFAAFKKKQQHSAAADINESIDELAHYRAQLFNL